MSTKRNDLTREYGDPGLKVIMALRNISSIMSLFGGRMFLNLKEAGGSRSKGATSPNRNTITTISAIRFANSLLRSRMYINLILTYTIFHWFLSGGGVLDTSTWTSSHTSKHSIRLLRPVCTWSHLPLTFTDTIVILTRRNDLLYIFIWH